MPELLREAANEIEAREPMDDSERIRLNNKLNALLEKIRDIRILLETYGGMNEN